MSSLPLISHRLFVAAVQPAKPAPVRPVNPQPEQRDLEAPGRLVEVVLDGEPGSRRVPRQARAEVCVI